MDGVSGKVGGQPAIYKDESSKPCAGDDKIDQAVNAVATNVIDSAARMVSPSGEFSPFSLPPLPFWVCREVVSADGTITVEDVTPPSSEDAIDLLDKVDEIQRKTLKRVIS